jgi:hypothetical protein
MATDKNGKAVKVGDLILVRARVQSVTGFDQHGNISALTEVGHDAKDRRYALPVLHGSQVELVEE